MHGREIGGEVGARRQIACGHRLLGQVDGRDTPSGIFPVEDQAGGASARRAEAHVLSVEISVHQRRRRARAQRLDVTPARLHLSDTCEDVLEEFDVVRGQHGIAELPRDRFACGAQEFAVAVRAGVRKPCRGRGLRRRRVQHPEPAGSLLAVCAEKRRVPSATRLLEERPTERPVRLLEEAVVAERRDFHARKDLLVDGALDPCVGRAGPLGDDGDAGRSCPLQPVHRRMSHRDPQRGDAIGLRVGRQLTPGLNGRVTH